MSRLLTILFVFVPLVVFAEESTDFSAAVWKRVEVNEGIELYRWEVPQSPVAAFKAEAMLDAPLKRVIAVIQDTARRTEWSPKLKEAKILERTSKTDWVEYWHIGTPPVISDRDIVIRIQAEMDSKQQKLTVKFHSVDPPTPVKSEYVRAIVHGGNYIVWPGDEKDKTHVIYQNHSDNGGSVPKWITRSFERDYPLDTIKGLRKQLKKSDIVEPKSMEEAL